MDCLPIPNYLSLFSLLIFFRKFLSLVKLNGSFQLSFNFYLVSKRKNNTRGAS